MDSLHNKTENKKQKIKIMSLFKTETEPKTVSHVYATKDYHLFKSIEGNRTKNRLHLNRLKKAIAENYLFTAIVVNEKREIIDGQHRFDVIKDLGLPLFYIICKGYGLKEVQILNQNSKTWGPTDYLEGYKSLGYKDYLVFSEFKSKYGLNHQETLALLSDTPDSSEYLTFNKGLFKVKSYKAAEDNIKKILMIEKYYPGVRRRSFIFTMMSLFKNPEFEFDQFLQKLKMQPTLLKDSSTITGYKEMIEQIYNYKRKDKINLRFS